MTKNILFLCTGNSARSILAEAILNHLGGDRFRAYSAGSKPAGAVNPGAIRILERRGIPLPDGARSKSWDEFACDDAPKIHIVITVCDSAAAETCPVWPGVPISAHWGIPDPAMEASVQQVDAAFDVAFGQMKRRIDGLLALSDEDLNGPDARNHLNDIGKHRN